MKEENWQDPARYLSLVIATVKAELDRLEAQKIRDLLGDFCQAVTEGVNDELEPVGNVEF